MAYSPSLRKWERLGILCERGLLLTAPIGRRHEKESSKKNDVFWPE